MFFCKLHFTTPNLLPIFQYLPFPPKLSIWIIYPSNVLKCTPSTSSIQIVVRIDEKMIHRPTHIFITHNDFWKLENNFLTVNSKHYHWK